jgi:hypothetical protein
MKNRVCENIIMKTNKHILRFQFDHFLGVHFSNFRLLWILTSFDVNCTVNTFVFAFST